MITRYGYENVLNKIYTNSPGFKWRTHVSARKFNNYLCDEVLTDW